MNQAVEARLIQAHCSPVISRQHPASPFSVSGLFSISVFRSCKSRQSSTVLQVLGRDEGPGSSKENLASSWKLDSRPVQEANIPQAVFVGAV
jgi:hypothetical protein